MVVTDASFAGCRVLVGFMPCFFSFTVWFIESSCDAYIFWS